MKPEFIKATRYAKTIPAMKKQNRREGVMRLLKKIKAAILA